MIYLACGIGYLGDEYCVFNLCGNPESSTLCNLRKHMHRYKHATNSVHCSPRATVHLLCLLSEIYFGLNLSLELS